MSQPPLLNPVDTSLMGEEHVRRYLETGGEVGYLWNGVPTLLLTTTGRKSGLPRTMPMIFTEAGGKVFVIASNGGALTHPAWFLNLQADPHVTVQIKADRYPAVARITDSPEREQLWAEALKDWPRFDVYAARTDRRIPLVVLERITAREVG